MRVHMLSIPMRVPPIVGGGGNFKGGSSKDKKNILLRRWVRVGASIHEYFSKVGTSLSPEERLAVLVPAYEQKLRTGQLVTEVAERKFAITEKECAQQDLVDVATFVAKRGGFLHPLGAIDVIEEKFRSMSLELMEEEDRQALWETALKDRRNAKLLECMKEHVEIKSEQADEEAVEGKIAEDMVKIYNQLLKDAPKRPPPGDAVEIDTLRIGEREAKLMKCVVEALLLKCRIIPTWYSEWCCDSDDDGDTESDSDDDV